MSVLNDLVAQIEDVNLRERISKEVERQKEGNIVHGKTGCVGTKQ